MSKAPQKRAWFQLHLSTAIVLMLAAGVLVWANVRNGEYEYFSLSGHYGEIRYGWPMPAVSAEFYTKLSGSERSLFEKPYELTSFPVFHSIGLLVDVLIVVLALVTAGIACEACFRRRAKPAP